MYTKDDLKGKPRAPKSTTPVKPYSLDFVPGDLTDVEKRACKTWEAWEESADDIVFKALSEGYKISVKLDKGGSGFLCIVQAGSAECGNQGLMLSGRGSTWNKAIKQALYRHYVALDGEWPTREEWAASNVHDD